ncbi:helix-turn-helix domain-containing protein [Aeoliella mucimassa]|uniref:helix-turn-helix domain-containing protein n=1 Tax=Aeoliella mucimassa TaxID=2527972 RepID=UPI0011AB14F4|nr:helix-turn-helix domain-containing protein [Aeoliella mucimassa]
MTQPSPSDALTQFRQQQAARFAPGACDALVGVSPAMERVRAQVAAAAASGANTLITGHDSRGLQQIAQSIHYRRYSSGEQGLLELDTTTALPSQLGRLLQQMLTSETQATLLIESVESLTAEQQFELLTAMARTEWQGQVLATQLVAVDNNMELETPRPALSDELQAVLTTLVIEVPPLAARPEDLPELARWYLEDLVQGSRDPAPTLTEDALDLLMIYSWPGEQTELSELLTAAAGRAREGTITARHLPKVLHHAADYESLASDRPQPIDLDDYLSRVEAALVTRALELAGGNKAEAARLLGVSRPRLYRKLEQMGLVEPTSTKPATKPTEEKPPKEKPVVEPPSTADDDIEFLPLDPE